MVATGGGVIRGVIRGGTVERGRSFGIGGRAVSADSGATVGDGKVRGGIGGRFIGVNVGNGFAVDSVAAEGVIAGGGD